MAHAHEAASQIVRQLSQWRPPLRSADADTLADIDTAKARSRDLVRNNPFAKNALRILRDSVIGPGHFLCSPGPQSSLAGQPFPHPLSLAVQLPARAPGLSLKPDHVSLGIPADVARSWARRAERRWELYANSPGKYADARRLQTFNQICQTFLHSPSRLHCSTFSCREFALHEW